MRKADTYRKAIAAVFAAALLLAAGGAFAASGPVMRLKDIAKVQGTGDNQLVGFGVVTGLAGSGDGVKMTKLAVKNMMESLGITLNMNDVNVDNIAAVTVTANLPAFTKSGDRVDVTVSSVGDADSLQGGTLIMTPLKGPDGKVYAVAQGPVSIGGYSAGAGGAQNRKGFPTSGRIPGGAIVQKDLPSELMMDNTLFINLNNPDFTLAARVQNRINEACGASFMVTQYAACQGQSDKKTCDNCLCCSAVAVDPATIKVTAPGVAENNLVSFIASVENVEVAVDTVSKVVINEKTGTIVMGGDVKINPVSIAHGSITVKIDPGANVSQPLPFSGGDTVVIEQPKVDVQEKKVSLYKVTAGDIVKSLNDMGVTPSDIIAILQALKAEGALQAELVIM